MSPAADAPALRLRTLTAGYGSSDALREVSVDVPARQVSALIGPNGAGKSTLMKCLAGVHRPSEGTVELFGRDVTSADSRRMLAAGVSLCPERRRIFPGMTVEDNLLMGAVTLKPSRARERVRGVYERFPWLKERRGSAGGNLSGGQQQILAICRAIMTDPAVLLLDEPSLGLSPRAVYEIADLVRTLAREDMTVVVVEQNVALGLKLADHVHVLSHGEITRSGTAEELQRDSELVAEYLG